MNRTKPKKPGAIPHQSLINPSSNSPKQQKTKKRALNPTSPTTPPVPVPPLQTGPPHASSRRRRAARPPRREPDGQHRDRKASTAGKTHEPPPKKNHGAVGSLKRVFHQHHPPEFLRFECEFGGGLRIRTWCVGLDLNHEGSTEGRPDGLLPMSSSLTTCGICLCGRTPLNMNREVYRVAQMTSQTLDSMGMDSYMDSPLTPLQQPPTDRYS